MRQFKWGFRQKLLLTTALVAPGLIGYGGRKAYAACVNTGGSTYLCSGAETTTQTINANNAAVTMDAGATVDTSAGAGNAITITGGGNQSFTNTVGGAISGALDGLYIRARDFLPGGSVTVNLTQTITGYYSGIYARNDANGALTINAADVTGTNTHGIDAINFNAATDLSITTTGTVTGKFYGIRARNYAHDYGNGALTINAADVTGTNESGIFARNNITGTDLSITATGTVTGNTDGIRARNYGSGALTINAVDVTGTTQDGISAFNNSAGTDLSITTTGAVTGGARGISANNNGTGALTVNAVDVTGTGSDGISAFNNNAGTDLSITTTGTVSGGTYGIAARNNGSGALTINAADVTGTNSNGISARNTAGADLSITSTGAVTGDNAGIYARNYVSGALTINAVDVTGTNSSGISVRNDGTDLSITTTGTVTGGRNGIFAQHYGTGALTINAVDVTGTSNDGIYATTGNNSTDLSITSTGTVTNGRIGIVAYNNGNGATVINAVDVTGGLLGIGAINNNAATDLTITATGTVTAQYGIIIFNYGSGAPTINVVNVTGTAYDGIFARSRTSSDITVTGAVMGGRDGIRLESTGDNTITIAAGASVTGGTYSLNTTQLAPGSKDTINLSGAIDGNAVFGAGDDVLNIFDTASFGANTANIDGGADNDTIALLGNGDGTLDGGLHTNFEVLQKSGAGTWTLTGAHSFSTSAAFTAGTVELAGNLTSPEVTNSAILRVGGTGNTASGTGTITGNFTQTAAGSLAVDVDADANTTDTLSVTGTADLAGTVVPSVTGTLTDTESFTILSAAGGTTNSGLTVADTVGFDFELVFDGNDVNLTVAEVLTVAQALTSLGDSNQKEVAAYLNALTDSGAASADITALITSLLALPDQAALQAALDQLIPSQLTGQIDTTVLANLTFGNAMMSCGVSEGAYAIVREGQCSWVKVTGRYKHHDAGANSFEFNERAGGIAGGMQFALPGEMRLGLALDYEKSETSVTGLAKSDADRMQAGVVLKNRWAGTSLAAAFTGGFAKTDASRTISLPTVTAVANSDQEIRFAGVKLRASHLLPMGNWYLRPQIDLNATHVHIGGYTETGAGAFNLVVASQSETIYSASPGLEIGSEFRLDDNTIMRPWVRAGATLFADTSNTVSASFAGAPTGLNPFLFTSKTDKTFFDVSTGVNLLWDAGYELRLNYDARFSKNSQEHTGGLKLAVKF